MNIGKRFESNFRVSVPDDVLYYRLKDAAQSFGNVTGGTNNLRFSAKNPCDCFLFKQPTLYALEMKSVGTTSISFERTRQDKGVIHYHQIQGLKQFAQYKGVLAGFVLNFRHKDNTEVCYFLEIHDFEKMIDSISKKSFNEKDLNKYNPLIIENQQLKVNYRYNVSKFIQDTQKRYFYLEEE